MMSFQRTYKRIIYTIVTILTFSIAFPARADLRPAGCEELLRFRLSHADERGFLSAEAAGAEAGWIDFVFAKDGRVLLHSAEVAAAFRGRGVYGQLVRVLSGMHPHVSRVAAYLERDNLKAYLGAREVDGSEAAAKATPFYKVYAAAGFSRIEVLEDRADELGSVYLELGR